jgi:hypothetical protein
MEIKNFKTIWKGTKAIKTLKRANAVGTCKKTILLILRRVQ